MQLQLNDFISAVLDDNSQYSVMIWGEPGEWMIRATSPLEGVPALLLQRQRGGLRYFKTIDAAYACITAELEISSVPVVSI